MSSLLDRDSRRVEAACYLQMKLTPSLAVGERRGLCSESPATASTCVPYVTRAKFFSVTVFVFRQLLMKQSVCDRQMSRCPDVQMSCRKIPSTCDCQAYEAVIKMYNLDCMMELRIHPRQCLQHQRLQHRADWNRVSLPRVCLFFCVVSSCI